MLHKKVSFLFTIATPRRNTACCYLLMQLSWRCTRKKANQFTLDGERWAFNCFFLPTYIYDVCVCGVCTLLLRKKLLKGNHNTCLIYFWLKKCLQVDFLGEIATQTVTQFPQPLLRSTKRICEKGFFAVDHCLNSLFVCQTCDVTNRQFFLDTNN